MRRGKYEIVGRLMDYSIGRRQMSSVLCFTVYQTLYRINHLFQNGRALLKCRIFILLQNNRAFFLSQIPQKTQTLQEKMLCPELGVVSIQLFTNF
jgi:hypothetical protein